MSTGQSTTITAPAPRRSPPPLSEKWDVQDDNVGASGRVAHATLHLDTDRGVHNLVQGFQFVGITEDNFRHSRSIKLTVSGKDFVAPPLHHGQKNWLAGALKFRHDGISVDQLGAQGDHRFETDDLPRSDPSSKCHQTHATSVEPPCATASIWARIGRLAYSRDYYDTLCWNSHIGSRLSIAGPRDESRAYFLGSNR